MDLFRKAKSIRLRSHSDKYIAAAEENTETITLTRDRSSPNATWHVEVIRGGRFVRLKSCHGTYLTASNIPFLPGLNSNKLRAIQTRPYFFDDPTTKWEPLRDGMQIRLRSFFGNFLRPHGGLPPWRNSVTHDVCHLAKSWDKMLWDVEVVERKVKVRRNGATTPSVPSDTGLSRSRSFSGSLGGFHKRRMSREFI